MALVMNLGVSRPKLRLPIVMLPADTLAPRRHVFGAIRAARRLLVVALWTLIAMVIQVVLLMLPGRTGLGAAKRAFPRFYWGSLCWLIGLKVRIVGAPAHRTADGRPVIYVCNHTSWLDVLVLGAQLDACFIAKSEVATWPLIGWIAWLGRTAFTSRQRSRTAGERDAMRERLGSGDSLILFPEGTSSDGSRVMPFRSAFLSLAEAPTGSAQRPPLVQPVSLVFDRLAGMPVGRSNRLVFAWYGDMDLASHAWPLLHMTGMGATLLLHPPMNPEGFPSRKALTAATYRAVADGAATLRQNRPISEVRPEADFKEAAYA
jgi:1-acyl-sn-glycerol-3-phosphate acyltransferase